MTVEEGREEGGIVILMCVREDVGRWQGEGAR